MKFRSIADLNRTIISNLHRLPPNVDLVIGVPRSGLLAATLIGLSLNCSIADVEGFIAGRVLAAGKTRRRENFELPFDGYKNILVVDDSANQGNSLREARALISHAYPEKDATYCAVYGVVSHMPGIDLILEAVPQPRMFQWNFMHHPLLKHCCVDIDGVLCVDPAESENDDGPAYISFLANARALYSPTQYIGWLVTSRLEKYRRETEAWLADHGVKYGKLIMLDLPNKQERIRTGAHHRFKASIYESLPAILFIESDILQARTITQMSGKPVLCVETLEIVKPSNVSLKASLQLIRLMPRRILISNVGMKSKVLIRNLLGSKVYSALKRLIG